MPFNLVQMWCVCRKALAKTGLQHAGPQPALAASGQMEQQREPSSTIDWTVSLLWPPWSWTANALSGSAGSLTLASVFPRTMLSSGNTSGSRPAAPETSVMLENNTALPNPWWVLAPPCGQIYICQSCGYKRLFIKWKLIFWFDFFFFLQQKSVARKKCAGCKISVHTMCMEQLEKVTDGSSVFASSFSPPHLLFSVC